MEMLLTMEPRGLLGVRDTGAHGGEVQQGTKESRMGNRLSQRQLPTVQACTVWGVSPMCNHACLAPSVNSEYIQKNPITSVVTCSLILNTYNSSLLPFFLPASVSGAERTKPSL